MSTQGIQSSLFARAGGLDLGAERAGYEVRAAVEWDADAAATMEKNFDHLYGPVIQRDILQTPAAELLSLRGAALCCSDVAVRTRASGQRPAASSRPGR